jgi:hypothetical protein
MLFKLKNKFNEEDNNNSKNIINHFSSLKFCFLRGENIILKQIKENEKEKVYIEEIRKQQNAPMFYYIQKLQEKDWEHFSKRKDSQNKIIDFNLSNFLFFF